MTGYFDYNATTPLSAAARAAWLAVSDAHWHNASSLYREAGAAKRRLEDEREAVAELVGCEPGRIVFTAGATESNNAVLEFVARQAGDSARVLMSAVEHPSVREVARKWFGSRVATIPLNEQSVPDLEALRRELEAGEVAVVSIMAANNETGVVHPWEAIAEICREAGVWFHCDAAQWTGKRKAQRLGHCDFVTVSGHKFGGPKGTGLVVIPSEESAFQGHAGGPQESGRRAGTEDLPGIAAMAAALRDWEPRLGENAEREEHRDWFESEIATGVEGAAAVGRGAERLWNTSMILLPEFGNLKWLTRLSRLGFAVSTGSACSSGKANPSHVMEAMGLDHDAMGRVLRVSSGPDTTRADWEALAEAVETVWKDLKSGRKAPGSIDLSQLGPQSPGP